MILLDPNIFFDLDEYAHEALFSEVSYVWEPLNRISDYLKNYSYSIEGEVSDQAYLINPETIAIGEGSIVEPGAYIKGPCIIGKNSVVRHGAYIRGNCIIGDRCVVGHATELKNVIMLNDAHAAHFAYVGDSILGNRVNLGAGTKCANLKLDNGSVTIYAHGEKIDTGMRKFGAVFGDDSQTGCNSVTNPGTLFGKKSLCYPCVSVGRLIPAEHVVKSSLEFLGIK